MSIFNKPLADRSMSRHDTSAGSTAEASISVVGAGMRIVGDVESNGVIKVEGVIDGSVRGARQVLLGRSGVIHGDVHTADAVIGGKVVGSLNATDRVEIQGTASVEGDIYTKSIVVFEGGCINGTVRVGEGAVESIAAAPPPAVRLAADA